MRTVSEDYEVIANQQNSTTILNTLTSLSQTIPGFGGTFEVYYYDVAEGLLQKSSAIINWSSVDARKSG